MIAIDLNCDMGELPEAVEGGAQEAILPHITSVNIACGGHAGGDGAMRRTVEQARRHGVAVGAHPGYPDRENFGRVDLELTPGDIAATVYHQLCALARHSEFQHVKPHGALYNRAARDTVCAEAIARGVARFSREVVLFGLARSVMLDVFAAAGFTVAAEGFADRAYQPDGTLRPRRLPGALIEDPAQAAAQALRLAREGGVRTLCIHGDTPAAAAIAAAVRSQLTSAGVSVEAVRPPSPSGLPPNTP